jgi:hypothetical protein
MYWRAMLILPMIVLASCEQEIPDLTVPGEFSQPRWQLKPGYDFIDGLEHIRVTLSVENPIIEQGKKIDFEVRFDWLSEGNLYNPFFDPNIPPPAALAVFDSKKHFVGDLFRENPHLPFIGRMEITDGDWWGMPARDYMGIHILRSLEIVTDENEPPEPKVIGPGKYLAQLIYFKSNWKGPLPTEESFRSNWVEFVVVANEAMK